MVADLHGPQPAQTVPLWGQSVQESAGAMGQPNASGTIAEVVSAALFAKATWGLAGATGTISCRDPLSLTRKRR